LSLTYIHLDRLIEKYDLNVIFLAGPGHRAPALLSNVCLEGAYSEVYGDVVVDNPVGLGRALGPTLFTDDGGTFPRPLDLPDFHPGGISSQIRSVSRRRCATPPTSMLPNSRGSASRIVTSTPTRA
jgi:hypothetical protein